jgi:hypothetical protein
MEKKTYSIFGAGAGGLYTAWRLLNGEDNNPKDPKFKKNQLVKGDILELYDWGKYNFSKGNSETREPGARICTWFYNDNKKNSYLELGGMRYSAWNPKPSIDFPHPNNGLAPGHRVVTTVIAKLGLDKYVVPFNVTSNQLFYLRTRNFYLNNITSNNPGPYAVDHYGAATTPDQGFTTIENLAFTPDEAATKTRADWNNFYNNGRISVELPETSVFKKGDRFRDIGYWNLMYDQLGSEGYNYAADGNGYSSNVINSNTAVDINSNNEFAPGSQYKTLSIGYSGMFNYLFEDIKRMCKEKGIQFKYHPDTRLHSILWKNKKAHFTVATRNNPWKKSAEGIADAAWMAMGRAAIEQVAQATQYQEQDGLDVLNDKQVSLYLESTIMQPSYKVGMFFDSPWWTDSVNTPYPAQITGFVITLDVVGQLKEQKFPEKYLQAMCDPANKIIGTAYSSSADLVSAVEELKGIEQRLTIAQSNLLTAAARRDSIGPSASDTPIRMVVYFGNNALDQKQKPVYGILASYDDEDNTTFWQELELGTEKDRKIPLSEDVQPLDGPREVPERMEKMLRKMLAEMHFGPNSNYSNIPKPLVSKYMDWSLPPFNAGYHQWAAHFDIGDVQRRIRKPSQCITGKDANIFIVGEAYSNDQAWVEGAYCTAESVLNDFFGVKPIIKNEEYPFICRKQQKP